MATKDSPPRCLNDQSWNRTISHILKRGEFSKANKSHLEIVWICIGLMEEKEEDENPQGPIGDVPIINQAKRAKGRQPRQVKVKQEKRIKQEKGIKQEKRMNAIPQARKHPTSVCPYNHCND